MQCKWSMRSALICVQRMLDLRALVHNHNTVLLETLNVRTGITPGGFNNLDSLLDNDVAKGAVIGRRQRGQQLGICKRDKRCGE